MAKPGAAPSDRDDARGARAKGAARELRSVKGRADSGEGALALDRVIHERMRLGIVSALAGVESLTFNALKELLGTTDGNLSVHARKLEEADYVTCTKSFEGRMPRTEYRLTPAGKRAFAHYVDHMEALIRATRER
ncbi:MAG: regulatory protein ArsR [Gemmatimonadetes bacterium]|nr:regulatory protein ArsR [Gemmatimonadota bacterium]